MALRSILLTSMPGAAKIYSNVVRHALEKRSSPNRILELPQLSLRCLNISLDHDHIQCYSEVCGFGPTPGPVLAPMTYPFVLTFPLQVR